MDEYTPQLISGGVYIVNLARIFGGKYSWRGSKKVPLHGELVHG